MSDRRKRIVQVGTKTIVPKNRVAKTIPSATTWNPEGVTE